MNRKDYQLIAEALKVVGIEEQEVWAVDGIPADDPGACWWKLLNELITRFRADPRFNEAAFRQAAVPPLPPVAEVEAEEVTTQHDCGGPVFGRLTAGCPRCEELKGGAPAVQGWGRRRNSWDLDTSYDIARHDCKLSNCAPICTFGDW